MTVIIAGFVVGMPASWAADEDAAEAAQVETPEVSVEHIRAAIEAETDPELREAMADQLELLESGQLDFQTLEREVALGAPPGPGETSRGFVGPPVDIRAGGGTTEGGGNYLPPEARAELEAIFSRRTGDPSKDGHLREEAEKVLEKYGVERTEMTSPREAFEQWEQSEQGQRTDSATREQYREMSEQYQTEFEQRGGLEQRGEGFERAMTEHMAPEAREQMERFMGERESMERGGMEHGGMEREMMEREFGGPSSERSVEASTHEYEAPEATTHEYEAPEASTTEHEAPGPGDGGGMGPY